MLPSSPWDVVEVPQLLVQEARRPRDREDPARLEVVDIAPGPVELPLPLLLAERGLRRLGELVHHRVPDRARELQHVRVHVAQLGEDRQVCRAGVILVEQPDPVVLHPQSGVADRAVGRAGERLDHDLEAAVELDHLVADCLDEAREAQLAQFVLHLAGGELR
jgi:hypothetical protein